MKKVFEIFVEKKEGFNTEAVNLKNSLKNDLKLNFDKVRILNRYLIEGLSESEFEDSIYKVFAEKNVDTSYFSLKEANADSSYIAVELLPGQFDIRANAASECLSLIHNNFNTKVKYTKVIVFDRVLNENERTLIEKYLINPVESQKADLSLSFSENIKNMEMPETYIGFKNFNDEELSSFHKANSLAMTIEDLKEIRNYFNKVDRDPNATEIKVLDTYWSDHCRHTTFNTELTEIKFNEGTEIEKKSYERYLNLRKELGRENKPVTLMDIGTIGARYLKKAGISKDIDTSDEINACSIIRDIRTDKDKEKYLIEFKNETHNHPTEIEPFGGAATCLGGAIRDPLAGRAFVYQAMRVTGAADPTLERSKTMEGKLPQRTIVTTAAKGYSSYGNQIGLATGTVREIYHPGYVAKRMEVGGVIASTPLKNVKREKPLDGDIVVLLGGRTGRDGVGGATGSSKSHNTESITTMGAEVQKGNAPTERKIQRLMRNNEAKEMIIKCNDFGAGGVAVAVGELADGLVIDLDKVPVKYDGLTSTETAVSESQERMACVVKEENLNRFMEILAQENIEGTVIARVTKEPKLIMKWRGKTVVDINREFLDSAGADSYQKVTVIASNDEKITDGNYVFRKEKASEDDILKMLSTLNIQSQRALNENFDSTNGAATMVLPFGGKYQDGESSFMAARIPLDKGLSKDATVMTYGFDPFLSEADQYAGAYMAVIESIAKVAVSGADIKNIRLSFQEYFEKLGNKEESWGKPFKSLLGALDAQLDYELPAIGGKDSMSGTFNDISVPPTLISFAVNTVESEKITHNILSGNGDIYLLKTDRNGKITDKNSFKKNVDEIEKLRNSGKLLSIDSAWKSVYGNLINMALGNRCGFILNENLDKNAIPVMMPLADSFIVEVEKGTKVDGIFIGKSEGNLLDFNGIKLDFDKVYNILNSRLSEVFSLCKDNEKDLVKYENKEIFPEIKNINFIERKNRMNSKMSIDKPKVLITVFPGSNCEYDLERAFSEAGAEVEIFVLRNQNEEDFKNSVNELAEKIRETNIIMIPGGFSAGDEPEGSGKFIANVFRNEIVKNAVNDFLENRDGLMLGICNGFQALIKLGLVPYGKIMEPSETMPTLTYNICGKHMDQISRVRIASVNSPWLRYVNTGEVYSVPISHGEGRFMANEEEMKKLLENGQIITQYCDLNGNATYEAPYNPNGSTMAVEGIVSYDGRILGKMGHEERYTEGLFKNYSDKFDMQIFKAGVEYFKNK